MKNYESILAFGDSHVAGCELLTNNSTYDMYLRGDISLEAADVPGKMLAFPAIVAKALGIPFYNYAMTGGSNQRSMRILGQALRNHPNSLVLFGYTSPDRNEFYYPGKNLLGHDEDQYLQVGMQWYGPIEKDIKGTKLHNPINDTYVKQFLHPHNNIDSMAWLVDIACKDVCHLMLNHTTSSFDNWFDFEGHTNYKDWAEERNFTKMPYLHYGRDAHEALAQLILKDIQ